MGGNCGDLRLEVVAHLRIKGPLGAPKRFAAARRRLAQLDVFEGQHAGSGHVLRHLGEGLSELRDAGADEQVLGGAAEVVVDEHPDGVRVVTGAIELDDDVSGVVEDGVAHQQGTQRSGGAEAVAPRRLGDSRPRETGGRGLAGLRQPLGAHGRQRA
jgi:hypothetical protein